MHNYSLFYYVAIARRSIEEDRSRLAAKSYPRPEQIFTAMQSSIGQAKPLQALARKILRDIGVKPWKFPKHPESLYRKIGAYRNAFENDPVLGRTLDQGRELLPPPDRLIKYGNPLLWRDAAAIPASKMIDGIKLENDLWRELSGFLQLQWQSLTEAFIEARKHDKFLTALRLHERIPIRCTPVAMSIAASGTAIVRSDAHDHHVGKFGTDSCSCPSRDS